MPWWKGCVDPRQKKSEEWVINILEKLSVYQGLTAQLLWKKYFQENKKTCEGSSKQPCISLSSELWMHHS